MHVQLSLDLYLIDHMYSCLLTTVHVDTQLSLDIYLIDTCTVVIRPLSHQLSWHLIVRASVVRPLGLIDACTVVIRPLSHWYMYSCHWPLSHWYMYSCHETFISLIHVQLSLDLYLIDAYSCHYTFISLTHVQLSLDLYLIDACTVVIRPSSHWYMYSCH